MTTTIDINFPIFTSPAGEVYVVDGDNTNCTLPYCPVEASVYGYRPTLPGSSALIALYAICMAVQIFLGFKWKTWAFMASMILGCFCEILGYGGRIMMYNDPWGDTGFIMQIVLITIGPVFFSAAIYVLLYQIIIYISRSASRFPPALFYWVFIPSDIISLVLQAVGGAMSSTSNGRSTAGVNIALAGLGLQVATLFFFVVFTVDYLFRSRHVWQKAGLPNAFKIFCAALAFGTVVIWIRCCYRVYELSEGYSRFSEALRDEKLFIGLESVMVLLGAYALIIAHPGPVFKSESAAHAPGAREKTVDSDKEQGIVETK